MSEKSLLAAFDSTVPANGSIPSGFSNTNNLRQVLELGRGEKRMICVVWDTQSSECGLPALTLLNEKTNSGGRLSLLVFLAPSGLVPTTPQESERWPPKTQVQLPTTVHFYHLSPLQNRGVTPHAYWEPSRSGRPWLLNLGAEDLDSKCGPVSAVTV